MDRLGGGTTRQEAEGEVAMRILTRGSPFSLGRSLHTSERRCAFLAAYDSARLFAGIEDSLLTGVALYGIYIGSVGCLMSKWYIVRCTISFHDLVNVLRRTLFVSTFVST